MKDTKNTKPLGEKKVDCSAHENENDTHRTVSHTLLHSWNLQTQTPVVGSFHDRRQPKGVAAELHQLMKHRNLLEDNPGSCSSPHRLPSASLGKVSSNKNIHVTCVEHCFASCSEGVFQQPSSNLQHHHPVGA